MECVNIFFLKITPPYCASSPHFPHFKSSGLPGEAGLKSNIPSRQDGSFLTVIFSMWFFSKKKLHFVTFSSLPAFNWFYHTKVRMCSTCSLQQIFRTVRVPKQTGTVSIFFGQQQRLPGIEQTGGVFIGRSVLPSNNNRHVSVNYAMGTVFL